jgi:beta-glucosidase
MADELGDVVDGWITHNEPWVVAFLGHAEGVKAPGIRDWPTALRVSHHLLLSHGWALEALSGKPAGITLNLAPVRSDDTEAALRMDGYLNRWFLDPVFRGRYPEDMVEHYERRYGPFDVVRPGDMDAISRRIDFLGVNYYMPQRVRSDPSRQPLELASVLPPPPTTAMGWEIDADGLHELLVRVRRDYGNVPIYITENGAAFEDGPVVNGTLEDPRRVDYLQSHVQALARAIADGVDVRRYFAWSMLDNFEWEHGYSKRFGLVYVDYSTQRRVPKRSALWYRDFIASV